MEKSSKKRVIVFDPTERCQNVLREFLQGMGYLVEVHTTTGHLQACLQGPEPADLVILNLGLLGVSYQEVVQALEQHALGKSSVPVVAVTRMSLSQEARGRLEELGTREVVSPLTPLMELLFAVNRLLFPKISELRKYTRVFGGFPIEYEHDGRWHQGEVYNISQEGAFVQCESPPPDRTRLRVRFVLPTSKAPLVVEALVNWISDSSLERDRVSPTGMGIRFITLNREDSACLERFVTEKDGGGEHPDRSPSSPA